MASNANHRVFGTNVPDVTTRGSCSGTAHAICVARVHPTTAVATHPAGLLMDASSFVDVDCFWNKAPGATKALAVLAKMTERAIESFMMV
jgi:hypothetical protein